MKITQKLVREYFDYHPDGYLIRRKRVSNTRVGDRFGCTHPITGYREGRFLKQYCIEHRLIFLWHHGYLPEAAKELFGEFACLNKIK